MNADIAVIGAGTVGCVTALTFAHRDAKVILLEAQSQSKKRLAGEWLHPPAVEILRDLGVGVTPEYLEYPTGQGFVVFPEDQTQPIQLNYPNDAKGVGCEHNVILSKLRQAVTLHPNIHFISNARVTDIQGQQLSFQQHKHRTTQTVLAKLIVGADGRSSISRKALSVPNDRQIVSYMAGILLESVELPVEGFGHVFLGGLGPALVYRIGLNQVRICLDVPINFEKKPAYLWDAYSPILPDILLPAFRQALEKQTVVWVANQYSPRTHYGRNGLALVGDATGHFHPMTATGMTVGFLDARSLVKSRNFEEYKRDRTFKTYVPEMLATTLHQVFSRKDDSAVAIRKAIYYMWRQEPQECVRTMHLLSGAETNILQFSSSFLKGVTLAVSSVIKENASQGNWHHMTQVLGAFVDWLRIPAAIGLSRVRKMVEGLRNQHRCEEEDRGNEFSASPPFSLSTKTALQRGVQYLIKLQEVDGSWEGEVVWCSMLPAQYVLMCHITQRPISSERREAILQQFSSTRLASGLWGLHEKSEPYLFVTTLVYVAARLLGVEKDDPLLTPALDFIQAQGGVVGIPTWGKFWLAMLNLYDWQGVNPVLPEVWLLPSWLPIHPGNFYCHTRLIYMPMGFIYGCKFQAPLTPLIAQLRCELYISDYETVNFKMARKALRPEEVYNPPSAVLKVIYKLSNLYEQWHNHQLRQKAIAQMIDLIHFELQTTDYTSLSPVSGMLNLIALWLNNPEDQDLGKALERFEGWMWQDEESGLRIAGARSSTWDTAFAIQALQAASPHVDVVASLTQAQQFLSTQQIRQTFANFDKFHRIDPKGGFCFAGVWHGWPVSDCTAEALLALLDTPHGGNLEDAVQFLLRCQNSDGGFGSYERRKIASKLEWMNPAEMFANSMTEHSYIECTASCLLALKEFRSRYSDVMSKEIDIAIRGAAAWLQRQQKPDGSWEGFWGVNFIYGTMFGIHGLLAVTDNPNHPAICKACDWLASKQKADGGWGENHLGCLSQQYVENTDSQVIQTAWAMMGLLKAESPNWKAIEKGAKFLVTQQHENGEWLKQDFAGVFFHTALLDYKLYRSYFPVWALGLYESQCQKRLKADCSLIRTGKTKQYTSIT